MEAFQSARIDHRTILHKIAALPWLALLAAILVGAAGVAALYSTAGGSMEPHAMRHLTRLVMGFAIVLVMATLPLRFWMAIAYPVYGLLIVSLALVPYLGTEAAGAQRWLALGPLSFQPAEPMKVALVLVLSRYFQAVRPRAVSHVLHVVAAALLIAVPAFLVMRQPDLGTALIVAAIGLVVLFAAGVSLWYFVAGAAIAAAVVPFLWYRLYDYQKERILIFLDPGSDPLGKGYQITQSKIALGAGGLMGRGYLQGSQSQLDFVPESHTDFIFSLVAEETGFLGGVALIALFMALVLALIVMAFRWARVIASPI